MVPTINRLALSLSFTVCLGFAFVPQGCGGVHHPVADIPEHVAAPIRGCAFEHTHHVRDADHIVKYDVTLDSNGEVDSIALMDSSVGDEELEQCIAASIRSLTENDLLRHRSENFDRELAQPESRMLLGTPAVPLAVCVASPPCLLALGMVVAGFRVHRADHGAHGDHDHGQTHHDNDGLADGDRQTHRDDDGAADPDRPTAKVSEPDV
ncbi:MAG: hypothetical protein IPM54_42605 [Polyangiaceae bacterium]|nr:hypothetical protein [Polyangiaceae bacterium]